MACCCVTCGALEERIRQFALAKRRQAHIGEHSAEGGLVVQVVKSMLGCHSRHLIVMLIVSNFQVVECLLLVPQE